MSPRKREESPLYNYYLITFKGMCNSCALSLKFYYCSVLLMKTNFKTNAVYM